MKIFKLISIIILLLGFISGISLGISRTITCEASVARYTNIINGNTKDKRVCSYALWIQDKRWPAAIPKYEGFPVDHEYEVPKEASGIDLVEPDIIQKFNESGLRDSLGKRTKLSSAPYEATILMMGCEGCGPFTPRLLDSLNALAQQNPETIRVYALYRPSLFANKPIDETEWYNKSLKQFRDVVGEEDYVTFAYYNDPALDIELGAKAFPFTKIILPDGHIETVSGMNIDAIVAYLRTPLGNEVYKPITQGVEDQFLPLNNPGTPKSMYKCPNDGSEKTEIFHVNNGEPTKHSGGLQLGWISCNITSTEVYIINTETGKRHEITRIENREAGSLGTSLENDVSTGLYDLWIGSIETGYAVVAPKSLLVLSE